LAIALAKWTPVYKEDLMKMNGGKRKSYKSFMNATLRRTEAGPDALVQDNRSKASTAFLASVM
jgi:hypothetical protein